MSTDSGGGIGTRTTILGMVTSLLPAHPRRVMRRVRKAGQHRRSRKRQVFVVSGGGNPGVLPWTPTAYISLCRLAPSHEKPVVGAVLPADVRVQEKEVGESCLVSQLI